MKSKAGPLLAALPILACVAAIPLLIAWWFSPSSEQLRLRVPGTDAAPGSETGGGNPVLAGRLILGDGKPIDLPGNWSQFRGPNRDGIATNPPTFFRDWKTSPPREVWGTDVGEGYAGGAIRNGRVYLLDYDREAKQSALRCLSLEDGKDIWRFTYPLTIKRNHGMTRTVPAVTDKYVVALDSKCNVLCVDSKSGELKWSISLVREFGASVPEWYASQCPLVDDDKVILAPGGKDALLIAVEIATGKLIWKTPNRLDWKMTHSSITPMNLAGRRLYVYCASKGVVGVDAVNGSLRFQTTEWKISLATVPSPISLPDGKIFLTGGYNAGSLMLQLEEDRENVSAKSLFRLAADAFGATQHTPILRENDIYGIRADGRFVCLGLDGKVIWASGPGENFGLGSFIVAGELIFAMNDSGKLSLIEATPSRFNLIGQTQVLQGRESWAPMAMAGNRLLVRDLTRLICMEVGK